MYGDKTKGKKQTQPGQSQMSIATHYVSRTMQMDPKQAQLYSQQLKQAGDVDLLQKQTLPKAAYIQKHCQTDEEWEHSEQHSQVFHEQNRAKQYKAYHIDDKQAYDDLNKYHHFEQQGFDELDV